MTTSALPATVAELAPYAAAGVLADADVRLAARLGRLGGETSPPVLLAIALALRAPRHGHVCVELGGVAGSIAVEPRPLSEQAAGVGAGVGAEDTAEPIELDWPEVADWRAALTASPLVRAGGPGETPLVLEGDRLYLDRYWHYEERLARALTTRAAERVPGVDLGTVRTWLDRLFPPSEESPGLDRQRLAAALAALRRLTVIAGGPGTGKTFTVTRVLALLHAEALARDPSRPLRAALAAPTGKAAARLSDSLREGADALDLGPEVGDAIARTPAFTLHRLLGTSRGSSTRFRHDAANPLPHDVVIVDEASMVSLPLMAKLVDAVRADARLVLLGDRDQLASVEAGAAFGDICGPEGSRPVLHLSAEAATELHEAVGIDVAGDAQVADGPGVWDGIVRLDRFHRFTEESPLGAVAGAIQRAGDDAGPALDLIREGALDEAGSGVRLLDPGADPQATATCTSDVVEAYGRAMTLALTDADPARVLDAIDELRVLCALRRGPDGVRAWNEAIEARLAHDVPGFRHDQTWYVGRPILVTENDYAVRLYNGDVGVILRDPERPDRPERRVAAFRATDDTVRLLSPARLPACETTFAMTIHKSQGSQFGHAVVVLPRASSPILTRELVYTAITRARAATTILATEEALAEALRRPVQRATGLQQRLWPRTTPRDGGSGVDRVGGDGE
jgi:exodeoxyribonuclease V alpha subunit